jgi:hypothetical protein
MAHCNSAQDLNLQQISNIHLKTDKPEAHTIYSGDTNPCYMTTRLYDYPTQSAHLVTNTLVASTPNILYVNTCPMTTELFRIGVQTIN